MKRIVGILLCFLVWVAAPCGAAADPAVADLVSRFLRETQFWQQADIGEKLARRARLEDLAPLAPWLTDDDRHVRGNVAWVFAKLGDRHGFDTLVGILDDRSAKRAIHAPPIETGLVEEAPGASADSRDERLRSAEMLAYQIREDRHYAVHLLGTLRDPRAVPVLIPLLHGDEQNYNAAWALGEIGDPSAIPALLKALSNQDAMVRAAAIGALRRMNAREALPQITALFDDQAVPQAGERVPIGQTARSAAQSLQWTGTTGARPGETLLEQMRRMQDRWRNSGVVAYKMWPYGEYNRLGNTPPVEVTVRGGKATDIVLTQDFQGHRAGEHFSRQQLTQFNAPPIVTIENFFTLIQKTSSPTQPAGTVDYDEALGYPTRLYIDDKAVADDEILVVVRKLEVLETTPSAR